MASQIKLKENKPTRMILRCRVPIMGVAFNRITFRLVILEVTPIYLAECPPLMNKMVLAEFLITKIKKTYITYKTIITCFNSKYSMNKNLMRSKSSSKEIYLSPRSSTKILST